MDTPAPPPASDPVPSRRPAAAVRAVLAASAALLRVERYAISLLMGVLVLLILLNVVTRYSGVPIYWVDEAAVYSVVWLTFIGASAMTRLRLDCSVAMLTEKLGVRAARVCKVVATLGVLAFGVALMVMCWLWMDPIGIVRAGFDAKEYAADSFNFLYTERTQTLNWPTWVVMLVMPLFAITFSLHAIANLLEDCGAAPAQSHEEFGVVSADAVN